MGVFALFASLGAGTTAAASIAGLGGLETFWALPAPVRAAILATSTLFVGVVVVGLFPEYGTTAVEQVEQRPFTSFVIGSVVTTLFVTSIGILWVAVRQGEVVGIIATPLLFLLGGLGLVWTAIGLVGICEAVTDWLGREHVAWGILGAMFVAGASVLVPLAGFVVAVVAAIFGFGAGIRTSPSSSGKRDRPIPPARKV